MPAGAVMLFLCIDLIESMVATVCNVGTDVASTLLVAHAEGKLDEEIYRR